MPLKSLLFNDFWGTPLNHSGSHGSYRPLVTITFRWTAQLAHSPFWYHLTNVLLHCAATALVVRFASSLRFKKRGIVNVSWTGGLLFAVHPVHCEAVAGIVGRADVMCTVFFLSGLLFYDSVQGNNWKRAAGTLLFTVASFLSKEYGITLPVVCILYDIIDMRPKSFTLKVRENGKTFIRWTFLFVGVLVLTAGRLWLSDFKVPKFSTADNPIAKCPSLATRTMTFLYLPVFHLGLALWPRWLSFDWSMDSIAPIETVTDGRNLLSATFYIVLAIGLKRRIVINHADCNGSGESRAILRLLVLTVVTFLPATNLFAYVGFVAAERIVYLPSVGLCLVVALGLRKMLLFQRSNRKRKALVASGFAVLIASFISRTWQRNRDWIDEDHLYRSAISINPPKALGNLGVVLLDSNRLTEAEWCFKQALHHRKNMADVHFNLGNLLMLQERNDEALVAYTSAIHFRPHLSDAYLHKAKVLLRLGRLTESEEALRHCLNLLDDKQTDLLRHRSAKVSSALLLAEILAKNVSTLKDAESLLNFARKMSPRNPAVYRHLGELFSEQYRYKEAAEIFLEAAQVHPTSISFTVAAGHALHDAKRDFEAELLFRRAVALDPSDVSHHVNLGAVLHVQGKLKEAERVYRQALELAPNHSITLVNLQRLQRTLEPKLNKLLLKKNQSCLSSETFC